MAGLVTYSELMASLLATGSEHLAAILVFHTGTEAVLIPSFALMRLKCPFHRLEFKYYSRNGSAKVTQTLWITKCPPHFSRNFIPQHPLHLHLHVLGVPRYRGSGPYGVSSSSSPLIRGSSFGLPAYACTLQAPHALSPRRSLGSHLQCPTQPPVTIPAIPLQKNIPPKT